jgi:hypothetical protein
MNDQIRFKVAHDMSIPGSRRGALCLLDCPEGLVSDVHKIKDVQVLISKFAACAIEKKITSKSASIYKEIMVDTD